MQTKDSWLVLRFVVSSDPDLSDELMNIRAFGAHRYKEGQHFRSISMEIVDHVAQKILNQYATVRALAPGSIVETGVGLFRLAPRARRRESPSLAETADGRRR